MNEFEKVVTAIGKGIEWPFVHGERLIALLTDALKDEPAVKDAVVGLISQVGAVTKDGAIAVAAKGIDIPDDMATFVAGKALFSYITGTFLPAIGKAYKDVQSDINAIDSAPPAPTPAPESAGPAPEAAAPGLHTVSPA